MKLKNSYSSGLLKLGIFASVLFLLSGFLLCGFAAENSLSHTNSSQDTSGKLTISKIFMLVLLVFIVGLFFWEPLPLYVLALMIPALLIVFRRWTGLTTGEALSGFSSEATITILCMFILSEGIRRSGFIQILGDKISEFSGDDLTRQLTSIVGLSGPTAGIINNTPVGNQTNLMVYGPGGYRFSDFLRVGAPLQVLLAIITPFAMTFFWSLS